MAEEVTKYVQTIEFNSKDAMRKLAAYEKKMDAFQRKQVNMSKMQASSRYGGSGRGGGRSLQGFAEKLRQQDMREAASVDKAKRAINRTSLLQDKYNDKVRQGIVNRLKEGLATAKTVDDVKDLVAIARRDIREQNKKLRVLQKQNFLMKRMQASSQQIAGNMVSAFAIAAGVASVTKVGQQFESVNNTMLAVSTNTQEAGENFKFVRDEAYRLGLGLSESGKNFAKMISARGEMSLKDTKAAFTGIAEMSTLLGLSSDESTRAINALQQISWSGIPEMV